MCNLGCFFIYIYYLLTDEERSGRGLRDWYFFFLEHRPIPIKLSLYKFISHEISSFLNISGVRKVCKYS